MKKVKCIDKIRDKHGTIEEYILKITTIDNITTTNRHIKVRADDLKRKMADGLITVNNLKLTSDNRIIDVAVNNGKAYVTRDVIQKIYSYNSLSFKSNIDLNSVLLKAKVIGAEINKFNDELYAIINQNNTVIASNKQLALHENSSNLFRGSEFLSISLKNLDTSEVMNMQQMFYYNKSKTIDFSGFDTSNVRNMKNMFENCEATELDLGNFNTSNVENMSYMFYCCKAERINLSSFDTRRVVDMNNMFRSCISKELDLRSFNTSNVKIMDHMFFLCEVPVIDLRSFTADSLEDVRMMFMYCKSKEIIVHDFNTININKKDNMYDNCKAKIKRV